MLEVEVEVDGDTEVIVNTNVEVTASNTNVAIIEDTNDIEVTVNRQEYVITGDEIYIPKRFEDAPTWMQNLITQVVDTSISAQIQDLNEISQSLESMIDAMEVAKNTYEMSIISSNDIDQRINTAVTTLNSSMQDADSTILEVAQTRVTPEEASAITIDVISAQLGSTTAGTIGATVSDLQTAIANEEEARSTSIEILTSSIEGAFDANATAMNYLNTYVGVTETGEKSGTGLLADVEILQKQNDGVIETTTGTYDVMINPENPSLAQLATTSEPYSTWRALDNTGISNRLAHIGDVYVKYSDTANGAKEYIASYKFIRTVVDETSPYATDSDGFTWALVIDQAAQDAYEQALNAYDLADSKRRVYIGNTIPTIMDSGDLWIPSANTGSFIAGEIYKYNGTTWIVATKYSVEIATINTDLSEKTLELANLDNRIDAEEQARIDAILLEEQARIDALNERILADAELDGRIDTEEQARIDAINDVSDAYKEYSRVVTLAIADGVLTPEEEVLIADASMAVTAAKDRLQGIIDKAEDDLNGFVDAVYQPMITSLQNQIDGKIENWFTISTNDPKASWVDADTRLKHNGDLWYQTDTKISYYYTSSTHTWNILDDAKAIQALTDAATAQTAANNAQTSANTANSLLADIASDSKFTPSEKSLVKKEWDSIQSEYAKNLAQGTSYSVSTAAYTTAYNALNTYITPLLASLTTTSDIVGTTFRATFKSYYDTNVDLLNAISNKINLIADGKITSYYMATFSAVQAMSTAWTASEKASNIGDLAVVHNDTTVDNNGTWRWDGANWVTTRDKKLVALASQVTALSTDLQSGDGTWADADSTLTNSLTTTINDKTAAVESKFAYNSIVGINGIYKKSGFGLTTNYISGSGTEVDPYVSEFWIDASRFKFTNSNVTGSVLPFTIDATGAVPQITFNGNVTFEAVDAVYSNTLSSNTSTNNDLIAQRLGYMNYADMVTAATNGQTIINGGYLRTSLIEVNSIVANQINTTGLVAENISSDTIDGKTITGGLIEGTVINGVVITGATIRASYLDLDGELEVLTNFYLCVGGNTTGVPALAISEGRYRTYNIADIDAIPSSGYANIYRIPSISIVKEPSTNFSEGTTYGTLRSYNTANAGHNMKAVKRRPTFQNLSGIHIATGDVVLKLGDITLGTFSGGGSNPTSNTYFHDFVFTSPYTTGYNDRLFNNTSDEVYLYNVPVFGDLRVERYVANIGDGEIYWSGWIKVYMAGGSHTLPFDWDNPSHVISIETPNEGSTARISGIQINNMI